MYTPLKEYLYIHNSPVYNCTAEIFIQRGGGRSIDDITPNDIALHPTGETKSNYF